jgi:hypothetical protein
MAQRQAREGSYWFMLGIFAARKTSKLFPFHGGQHHLYLPMSDGLSGDLCALIVYREKALITAGYVAMDRLQCLIT